MVSFRVSDNDPGPKPPKLVTGKIQLDPKALPELIGALGKKIVSELNR